ncbi:MAG: hypothetical protein UC300_12115, partial [Prevotella sp.]|nr:hypothetical protein [Prevotella sp.]
LRIWWLRSCRFESYQAHPLILIAYQQAVRIFLFVYPSPIGCAVITRGHPMARLSASTFDDTTTDRLEECVEIEEG